MLPHMSFYNIPVRLALRAIDLHDLALARLALRGFHLRATAKRSNPEVVSLGLAPVDVQRVDLFVAFYLIFVVCSVFRFLFLLLLV